MKKTTGTLVTIVAATALYFGFSGPVFAPVFLKIEGIDGESDAKGHKDEIDVLSWSWGESSAGGTPGEGPGVLTVSKTVDRSSPKLQQHCNGGKHLNSMNVSDGTRTYTLYDVRVSCSASRATSGAAADERPTEEVAFYYNKISFAEAKPKRKNKEKDSDKKR